MSCMIISKDEKVQDINAISVEIPGYTYWIKCLTTNHTISSDNQEISYDFTPNIYSSISITYNNSTLSLYSAPGNIDMSGFGYKYSYRQHVQTLDTILSFYSGPNFTVPNTIIPDDLDGFFVYLLDNGRNITAESLCGTTTSCVDSCVLQQKTDLNSDWCLLIGNFYVNQSVNFEISYQTYSPSKEMSETTKIILISTICGGGVIILAISLIAYKYSNHSKLKSKFKSGSNENLDEDFLKHKPEFSDMYTGGKLNDDSGNNYNLNGHLGNNDEQNYNNSGDPPLYDGQNFVKPTVKNVKDVKKVVENVVIKDEIKEDKADILVISEDNNNMNRKKDNISDDIILKVQDEELNMKNVGTSSNK
ncbi:3383_t:CDS:2 [Dentiscutata erythropus]|uniref:3383_t:CDS:1 n=1 Tax=Dentiscutata erythropus TaxID=1348616 RepID=A0A9N9CLQ8_9GLOM|nr:3383_t:CDS:2 [Dentiscutata erythropus]